MTTTEQRRFASSLTREADRVLADIVAEEPAIAELFRKVFSPGPHWRYYAKRGAIGRRAPSDLYFFTTEATPHKGRPRYRSGVYRYLKSKKQWRLSRPSLRFHALRRDAKARALRLYRT